MTMTDWIQAVFTVLLVLVTSVYVWLTHAISKASRQQAEASIKMAEEMLNHRQPIIDIYMDGEPIRRIGEQMSSIDALSKQGLSCKMKNIGLGPAIDFSSEIINPANNQHYHKEFGTLLVNEEICDKVFYLQQDEGQLSIIAHYKDIYGRSFKSKRPLIGSEENWRLGKLTVVQVKNEDDK